MNIVALSQNPERKLRNHKKKVVIQLKENIGMGLGIFKKKRTAGYIWMPYDSFNCLLFNVRQNNLLCGSIFVVVDGIISKSLVMVQNK